MKIKIDNTLEQNIQDILDNNGTSIINAIMLAVYPVGSIYMSVNNINPETLFGGTWVAWGTGKVPVGVDTSQSEFNTVEKTGGSKYLQEHEHSKTTGLYKYEYSYGIDGQVYKGTSKLQDITIWSGKVSGVTTGNSGNLQPYITCYMWKRTA